MRNALGRAGTLLNVHGSVETPAFAAVGTKATVKALTPKQLKESGVGVVLGNAYHLYLEPGERVVEAAGGLGKFMGWDGPTMTDSGGFQVFSLGAAFGNKVSKVKQNEAKPPQNFGEASPRSTLARIDDDGVTFRSPKDGSEHRLTPERSIEIQHSLGADIIFAFDECASPDAPKEYQRAACERTHRWATRCLEKHRECKKGSTLERKKGRTLVREQALFGIVQGGRHEDLRKESARTISGLDFDGFGIGGSFEKEDIGTAVKWVNEILPEEKPRHLLGIGEPLDLFEAVENGCDLFDCVAPTRNARNGTLYTRFGKVNIENARYKNDFSPIEPDCGCYACTHFTRAYLAHLFRSGEILANTLATIHNLYFIVHLVRKMRAAILEGTFEKYKMDFLSSYNHH